ETVNQAKQEAARIYREIGIETVWIDHSVHGQQQNSTSYKASEIYVNIPEATRGLGLFSTALGIAPGEGCNRGLLYINFDRVEKLYLKQIASATQHKTSRWPTAAQILGYAIAHELGHLLGIDGHSNLGIMRAAWNPTDFLNIAYRDLAFTPQQA